MVYQVQWEMVAKEKINNIRKTTNGNRRMMKNKKRKRKGIS
jgi:hypothetical protein